jgi:hypothetical protein
MTSNIDPTEIFVTVDNISLEFWGTFIIHLINFHIPRKKFSKTPVPYL